MKERNDRAGESHNQRERFNMLDQLSADSTRRSKVRLVERFLSNFSLGIKHPLQKK